MQEIPLSTKYIYKGSILNLRIDTVALDNGQTGNREIVEHVDSVGIIAIDQENNIFLIKQFRLPANKFLLEIPAGCVDPGEDSQSTAIRELREETGYTAGTIKKMGGFYLAPGYVNEYMHIYLATDLSYDPLTAEDTEGIELIRQPLTKAAEIALSPEMEDCKSIAAILMYLKEVEP